MLFYKEMKYRSIGIFLVTNKHGYYKHIYTTLSNSVYRPQWIFYCNMQQWINYLCLFYIHDNWRLCCTWFIYFMNLKLITVVEDFIFLFIYSDVVFWVEGVYVCRFTWCLEFHSMVRAGIVMIFLRTIEYSYSIH